eukprot:3235488-Pyramimonas_sp.AAC.2
MTHSNDQVDHPEERSCSRKEGVNISQETLVYEAAMAHNLLLNFGGSAPANALLVYTPRDFYGENSATTMAHKEA